VRIKSTPDDFQVEELIRLPLTTDGNHSIYRVQKRAVTTMVVETQIARALNLPSSAVRFPALKDRNSVAIQYAGVKGGGPPKITGRGFTAERVGRSSRHLRPSDLRGNRFSVTLRDLSSTEPSAISEQLLSLAQGGLPNYFDQQRFGSQTVDGDLPGKRIILRDAEGALRAHMAEPMVGDPRQVKAFKRIAAEQWGDWAGLMEAAPRPSNFRSVLTFLGDHPTEYRKALNLVTPRLLSLYVGAYQSLLWNRIVSAYLTAKLGEPIATVEVAGFQLALFNALTVRSLVTSVPLPQHRSTYQDPTLSEAVTLVLVEEGVALGDLKPRILKKAYLPKGERKLALIPEDTSAEQSEDDDLFPGRQKLTVSFSLPPGSYATLILKAIT
jgi:tRNA pseudouridine13 synthase